MKTVTERDLINGPGIPNHAYVEINWNYLRNDLQASVDALFCFAHNMHIYTAEWF